MASPKQFTFPEEYLSWDYYIKQTDTIEHLTMEQRDAAKQSIAYLSDVLGTNFLRHTLVYDDTGALKSITPLWRTLINEVVQQRLRIIRFAEALKALSGASKFQSILKRLQDNNKFDEAFSVLDIAYKFHLQGFTVDFDPPVQVQWTSGFNRKRSETKYPDISIVNQRTSEEVFVEVSALGTSDEDKKAERTFHSLWELLHFKCSAINHLYYARIHRSFDERGFWELAAEISTFIESVWKSGKWNTFIKDGVIELGIGSEQDKELVEAWANSRGIQFGLDAPALMSDELTRMKRTLQKEMRQISSDKPAVIVITTTNNMLLVLHHPFDIRAELDAKMSEYTNLLCTTIVHQYCAARESESGSALHDNQILFRNVLAPGHFQDGTAVFNTAFRLGVSDDTRKRIGNVFTTGS